MHRMPASAHLGTGCLLAGWQHHLQATRRAQAAHWMCHSAEFSQQAWCEMTGWHRSRTTVAKICPWLHSTSRLHNWGSSCVMSCPYVICRLLPLSYITNCQMGHLCLDIKKQKCTHHLIGRHGARPCGITAATSQHDSHTAHHLKGERERGVWSAGAPHPLLVRHAAQQLLHRCAHICTAALKLHGAAASRLVCSGPLTCAACTRCKPCCCVREGRAQVQVQQQCASCAHASCKHRSALNPMLSAHWRQPTGLWRRHRPYCAPTVLPPDNQPYCLPHHQLYCRPYSRPHCRSCCPASSRTWPAVKVCVWPGER